MSSQHKISLYTAILINLNIMLGSGVFINTAILTKQAGSLGALVYALVGILLFPLILAIKELWQHSKGACTFYHFGLPISPFWGFLSSWSYFIAKICSLTLGIHVCVSLLQQIIPSLNILSAVQLDIMIIGLFTLLNSLNLKIGQSIQYGFIFLKLVPIFFVIFSSLYLFNPGNFTANAAIWDGILPSIPLVLFAFAGFEATCSLSQSIENSEKNGPKAILFSYGFVVILVTLFQLLFFGNIGSLLGQLPNGYLDAFPTLLTKLFSDSNFKTTIMALLNIGIASSSLGAAFGIMFSNSWNLYTLSINNHTFAKNLVTSLNRFKVPYICVLIEGLLGVLYITLTQGQQVPLQQVAALGSVIAYTFSVCAYMVIQYQKHKNVNFLGIASISSCILLISSFIFAVATKGISSLLLLFLFILMAGSYMFYHKHETKDIDTFESL